jgi:hypothetical protein
MDHYRNEMCDGIKDTGSISKCMERENYIADCKERYEKVEVIEQVDVDIVVQP